LEIPPSARKAISVIVNAQPRRLRAVAKRAVPFIVQEKIRRTVARIEIWNRIVILIQAGVIAIQTKINIQQAVAVVICNRSVRERALRRPRKLKRIALQ